MADYDPETDYNLKCEMMAVTSQNRWRECTGNVPADRRMKALLPHGGVMPTGYMLVKFNNNQVALKPINKVADYNSALVGERFRNGALPRAPQHIHNWGKSRDLVILTRVCVAVPLKAAPAEGEKTAAKAAKKGTKRAAPDGEDLDDPDTEARKRMTEKCKLKNPEKYRQEIVAFGQYAKQMLGAPPTTEWCMIDDDDTPIGASLPQPFNNKMAWEYSVWLLRRDNKYKKGDLCNTRSALNFYYNKAGMGTPWTGSAYWKTMDGYKASRLDQAIENGEKGAAGLRTAVPEDTLVWLLDSAEALSNGHEVKSAMTLMLLGWVCGLRSASMSFEVGNIKFVTDRAERVVTMLITSRSLKMEYDVPSEYKCLRMPAAPIGASEDHPRKRLFALVENMIEYGNVCLAGAPLDANGVVTKWMENFIPADKQNLPEGHQITSHSLRKSMASAANALGIPMSTGMAWGRWKTESSYKLYIVLGYSVTKFSAGMFDWLLPYGAALTWASDL